MLVEAGGEAPSPPLFRAQRHLIVIAGGANFAVCDHTRGFAFCRLNATAAADRDFTRYYFLDAMALFTLTQLHVTPVHAATVEMVRSIDSGKVKPDGKNIEAVLKRAGV